jgi:hypothetical protein
VRGAYIGHLDDMDPQDLGSVRDELDGNEGDGNEGGGSDGDGRQRGWIVVKGI